MSIPEATECCTAVGLFDDDETIQPGINSHERGGYRNLELDLGSVTRNTTPEATIQTTLIDRGSGYINIDETPRWEPWIRQRPDMTVRSTSRFPDTYQPSGSVNMSRIDSATLTFTATPEVITNPNLIQMGGSSSRMKVNALEANSITIGDKNILSVVEDLEKELEEAKSHIQRLYDEVEKLLLYQPGAGTMYSMALTRFKTNQQTHQVSQHNNINNRPNNDYMPVGTFACCLLLLLCLLSILRFIA